MEGCLSHHGLCVKVSERQRDEERFHNTTKFVDIAQLSEMLTLSKAEKHRTNVVWKLLFECPCSFSFMNTAEQKFPKLRACLSVTQHCGVACCPVIVNWPSLHFRLMEKTAPLLQLMTDMCLILFQSHFWESPEVCQTKSNWSCIISKDLNWNNFFVELGLFGSFCVICILSWLYLQVEATVQFNQNPSYVTDI